MVRFLFLGLAGAGSYALLRGWPAGMPGLLRGCLAVLLLVGGLGFWSARRQRGELEIAKGTNKPGWVDFLAIGTGILALECLLLWMLSVLPGPLEEVAIRMEKVVRPAAAAEREKSGGGLGRRGGNWLWDDGRERKLPQRTNLKPGAKPEVFVRLVKEEDAARLLKRQLYVRAFVLDEFRNGTWTASGFSQEKLQADGSGWIDLGEREENEIPHEVFLGKDPAGRNFLTAIQGVRAVRLPELTVTRDGTAMLPDVSGPAGFEYLASSLPVSLTDLEGEVLESEGKPDPTGSRKLSALAEKAAGKGSLGEKLAGIVDFLQNGYGYSLVTENRKNLEPLENFLFEEKRGHCEFFATAGALMAREIGVESRVAYGWAGGQYFKESRMFVFRAREAHAWVEVRLKGYGWVVMEPTPPVVLGGGGAPRIAAADEKLPGPEDEFSELEEGAMGRSGQVERMALWLAGAFGVFAVAMFLLRRRRQEEVGGENRLSTEARRAGYEIAWRKAAGGGKGVTMSLQLKAMGEDSPDFGEELREYHYGVRYEEKPPDAEREGRLERKILRWVGRRNSG